MKYFNFSSNSSRQLLVCNLAGLILILLVLMRPLLVFLAVLLLNLMIITYVPWLSLALLPG